MAEHEVLLPGNATPLERMLSEVNDELVHLAGPYELIRLADVSPPPAWLSWLVWEYGLGELSPFLPNLSRLIAEGIQWQRVRGTPAAIFRGLSWLGYAATIEEEPTRHRRWNRFQIELDRVRDDDLPDLRQIDGIVALSPPARSKLGRGFHGYDIRAAETSYQRTSASLTSDHSGVFLPGVGAKWSFGRVHQHDVELSEAELTDLDVWIEPVGDDDLWSSADYLWADADFAWASPAAEARRAAIASGLCALSCYIRFDNASDETIGFARATARSVSPSSSGSYSVLGSEWSEDLGAPEVVIVLASSGFGDGAGVVATSMSVVFDGALAPCVKAGKLWLSPSQLVGGTAVAPKAVSIEFGLTVREQAAFILRF
jgi:hypothetical protein